MLKSTFFTAILLGSLINYATAQFCEYCTTIPSFKSDHCYSSPVFPGLCVQFSEQEDFILFERGKKKTDRLPFADVDSTGYYLKLAANKKLKIDAVAVLFLQEAYESWDKVKRDVGMNYTESGLGIKILKQGDGDLPGKGQKVKVHYTGTLADGVKFDSSVDRGVPFEFPLGTGRVIKGWDEGISLLQIGTKAILKVPPELGYGLRGAGSSIPPNSTLYFEVELIDAE
ncbi:MAG: FKBP-type peptidyl-prolyl cis-trans isomerase [Cyclobacteriaceae bacterium]